jgi:hypothetical protein
METIMAVGTSSRTTMPLRASSWIQRFKRKNRRCCVDARWLSSVKSLSEVGMLWGKEQHGTQELRSVVDGYLFENN